MSQDSTAHRTPGGAGNRRFSLSRLSLLVAIFANREKESRIGLVPTMELEWAFSTQELHVNARTGKLTKES